MASQGFYAVLQSLHGVPLGVPFSVPLRVFSSGTVMDLDGLGLWGVGCTTGALIIRIGFWGILYHNYNKEPPK